MENQSSKRAKVANTEYLTQLSKGNTGFVQEMIRIFLSENPEEIRSLEQAINERDYDLIRATTHKLRSTLPYLGLDKVVEREIDDIEGLAMRRTGIDQIQPLFQRIKETCEQAYTELQAA